MHPKPCKLCFDTCNSLFGGHLAGFPPVVDEVVVVDEFLNILVYVAKVGVEDLSDVVQLTANTAG